jgi:hypothetical protein
MSKKLKLLLMLMILLMTGASAALADSGNSITCDTNGYDQGTKDCPDALAVPDTLDARAGQDYLGYTDIPISDTNGAPALDFDQVAEPMLPDSQDADTQPVNTNPP